MKASFSEGFQILRLAVMRGELQWLEAERWLTEIWSLPVELDAVDWLVERGALTLEQVAELRRIAQGADKSLQNEATEDIPGGMPQSAGSAFPRIPGYIITRTLGRGRVGVVYEALQECPRRVVALKVLTAARLASAVERRRFEREAQAAADLFHPGIATVYEFGEGRGQLYLTMEFVQGSRIDKYAEDHGLSVRGKLLLAQRACEAVAYGHQHGVIHGDLKPSNILVDRNGQPKVLDFGTAGLMGLDAEASRDEHAPGGEATCTATYMAPEHTVVSRGEADVTTDVYALGLILYRMLTDRLPHGREDGCLGEVARRIQEEPPERPSAINRALSDEIDAIVLKALAREKDLRYQSAAALGADIGRYLARKPVAAMGDSPAYWLRKLISRYRWVLVGVLAGVVVLTAVIASTFFGPPP